jgi:CrcB protein
MLGRDNINPSLKLFLFVGIFGSFTTFSTYMFESYDLIKLGSIKSVILYLGLSNILGLILVYLGFVLGDYIQKP